MLTVNGYTIYEKIHESQDSEVYRGTRNSDNQGVIFKLLKEEYPSLAKISRFLHEYEILKKLNQEGTIAIYDLQKHKNSFIIIVEAFGDDLQKYLDAKQKLQLAESLTLAIRILENVDKLHRQHVIHKDINPSNILFDPVSGKIKLIDFGISTTLPKETLEISNINKLEGTLPYISPEQTGRMNRGIDYRSDYYSLGITLYQIFTGTLPFESKDPLELVYSHIAKFPPSPHELDSAIPKIVSDIIMKLLAKTAEERYQSSYGILSDLEECLLQLQKTGIIKEFPLGTNDLSSRFQISEKLYGRNNEVKLLLNTFDRVSNGRSELMLVAGHSGIGKTSLVHELHKPIVEKHGYFVSGKFDQLKRNIPYAPFVQALETLIQQLLTESEERIKQWKVKLTEALGPNGGVISEVLPAITRIIGEQQPMLSLGPTETQNRFILVFQNFIQVLATQEHPLVIFLDDLQWVDLPSLKLLESLLSQPTIKHLLVIGAYRNNEVSPAHPLMLSLENFNKEGIPLETLTVGPLQVQHIQELLADTMSQKFEGMESLAKVCHEKTLGNPFFLNQFLRALCDEELILFDTTHRTWHWLIDKIKMRPSTENVVDLVVENIHKLPMQTHKLLTFASCLGNIFDLQMLSALLEKNPKETAECLEPALQQGYILPIDESYRFIGDNPEANAHYQFLHDRVQQASYSLLKESEAKLIHLTLGKYLLTKYTPDKMEEKLFDIVNQFNLGIDLLTDEKEKNQLAHLNLRAAKKAKSSAAYPAAFNYTQFGLQLLPINAWQQNYSLTLQLFTEAAEAAYLSDNFARSEELANTVLANTKNVLDQVKVYEIKIYTEVARNAPAEAVAIAIVVLDKLGIKFPKNPKTFHVLISLLKIKFLLIGKTKERLVNLPAITDPYKEAACNILTATIAPAYFATPLLFPLVTLSLLNLSIRYGYNKGAPSCYASYGIILCGILGDVKTGYLFGQLAQQLVEHYHALDQESKIALMVNGFVLHWQDPYRDTLAPLLAAHLRGVETGDLEYSTYSAYFYMVCSFYAGVELPKIADDMKRFYEFSKYHHTHKPVFYSMLVLGQVVDNLLGLTENPAHLVGKYYNEDTMIQEAIDTNNLFGVYSLYVVKLILNYIFGNYEEAHKSALIAPKYLQSATGSLRLKFLISMIR